MSLSKKTRFEVFKRDNFKCGYCGNTPPSVILEVDHIKPRSKQGKDDYDNLITSCFDCNRGKSDRELTEITPALLANLELIKEREAQLTAYYRFVDKADKRILKDINEIDEYFHERNGEYWFSESFRRGTLKVFLKTLNKHEIIDALAIACDKHRDNPNEALRYFCGICWNWIKRPETKRGKYG